uniref:Olfactory receptor family 51 subfamily M member 1 n=1 Tax=Bos mutus grunniens TaxID=30521 RepID=A0A8C0A9T7_BOSMU
MVLNATASRFLLTGFPGMEKAHHWISIPFLMVYVSILLGSGILLFLTRDYHNLHEPMYCFLAMLAATNLGVTLTMMLTVWGILWLNHREISHRACFSQAYFIHTLSIIESGVLLAVAYDGFTAICNPLRYTSNLTNSGVIKIGMEVLTRAGPSITPIILLLPWFPYFLSHSFCLHQEVIHLACTDTTFNNLYGLILVMSTVVLDLVLIALSYGVILHTVARLASKEERLRAFQTCTSHLCAVLVFFVPMVGLSLIHRFGKHAPLAVHLFMANVYLFVPPMLNPIIYSIKTKEIRQAINPLEPCAKTKTKEN